MGRQRRAAAGVLWGAVFLGLWLPATWAQAGAGAVSAVPKLDLNRYLTAWNVQAWLPSKAEKRCAADVDVLYAFGDKPGTFQLGTFCRLANGSIQEWGNIGKVDKAGGGKLKLRHWVLLSRPYWVLAVGQDYQWALVGTPNHKQLWVLSRAVALEPAAMAEIQRLARAQGFDPGKLATVTRRAQVQ